MGYKSMEGKQWLKEGKKGSVFDVIKDNIMNVELMLKNMKDIKKNLSLLLDIWKLMNNMTCYLVCIVYIVRPYNATVSEYMILWTRYFHQ